VDHQELWVRLFGLLAFSANMAGFVVVSERQTKGLLALSSALWGVQYLLLGVHTGFLIMVLASVRQAISVFTLNMRFGPRVGLSVLFTTLACAVAAWSWQGWLASALPLVATVMGTWAFFMLSNVAMRKATMVSNLVWALHAYLFNSWELLAAMTLLTLATLLGLYRIHRLTI